MINDTIADALTRIRNATLKKHQIVQVYNTKVILEIVKVLRSEGFIQNFERVEGNHKKFLLISLKYKGRKRFPIITGLQRVSKPGLRVYSRSSNLPTVLGGLGIAVISTSQGIMSNRQAKHIKLGGEVLCYIW